MFSGGRETSKKSLGQDKGQTAEVKALCGLVKSGGDSPISLDDLVATTRATFRILESLRTGHPLTV